MMRPNPSDRSRTARLYSRGTVSPAFQALVDAAGRKPTTADTQLRDPTKRVGQTQAPNTPPKQTDAILTPESRPKARLIVAVDFGTTYSTVAYLYVNPGSASTNDVQFIVNWPKAPRTIATLANVVPTKVFCVKRAAPDLSQQSNNDGQRNQENESGTIDYQLQDTNLAKPRAKKRKLDILLAPPASAHQHLIRLYWGYAAQKQQKVPEIDAEDKEFLNLVKLTLSENDNETEGLRAKRIQLAAQVNDMKARGLILSRDKLLADCLTELLKHTKNELSGKSEGRAWSSLEDVAVEFVICVPVIWSTISVRTMHTAMVSAIEMSGFQELSKHVDPQPFIVSEPEAGAQCVLSQVNGHLSRGEIFVLCDLGGGTVDFASYMITSNTVGQLRLGSELVPPDGAPCGSQLIYERFLDLTRRKLEAAFPNEEPHLRELAAIKHATEWDDECKPFIDTVSPDRMQLRDAQLMHHSQVLHYTAAEIRDVFEPSLTGTIALIQSQIDQLACVGARPNRLIVTGGFGDSPALQRRVKDLLQAHFLVTGVRIEPSWPKEHPRAAVAMGAVFRGTDRRNGPSRISRSSFGFLYHEECDKANIPAHNDPGAIIKKYHIDGGEFVYDTIRWLINKGDTLPPNFRSRPFPSAHRFALSESKLICCEALFESPHVHEQHYNRGHAKNRGASQVAEIAIDVTNEKTRFPQVPKFGFGEGVKKSNRVRQVIFDLIMYVEGTEFKFEAQWPAGVPENEVQIRKTGTISLSPTFAPGTAL